MASVTLDANGNWIARFRTGGRGSRRVYENLGPIGEREARRRAADLEAKLRDSAAADPNITFNRLADVWCELHVARKTVGSQRAYAASLKHLRPEFGTRKVRTLKPIDAELFLARREAAGAAAATRSREFMVFAAILNFGERKGLIDRTPLRRGSVARPVPAVKTRTLEPAEWARLARAAEGHPSRLLWWFMILTATRISEAVALSWRDVDFKGREVTIYQAKTKRSKRLVLTKDLEAVLRAVPAGFPDAPVFRNGSGGRWTEDWARRCFASLCVRAGLVGDPTPHVLRKTAATLAYRAGATKDRVLGLLDDRNPAMLKHYVFERPADFAEAQDAVVRGLGGRTVDDGTGQEAASDTAG